MTMPIAFRQPELRALDEGRLRFFRRRAAGALAKIDVDDRLWIREPFFLAERWENFAPSAALKMGATPRFLDQVGYRHDISALGRQRAARELCRFWHRRHLVVTARREERLRDINDADLAAAGYQGQDHFRELWQRDVVGMIGRGTDWRDNPTMLRFEFALVDEPLLPAEPTAKKPRKRACVPDGARRSKARAQVERRQAEAARFQRSPPTPIAASPEPGKQWCDQCDRACSPLEVARCHDQFCKLKDAA